MYDKSEQKIFDIVIFDIDTAPLFKLTYEGKNDLVHGHLPADTWPVDIPTFPAIMTIGIVVYSCTGHHTSEVMVRNDLLNVVRSLDWTGDGLEVWVESYY